MNLDQGELTIPEAIKAMREMTGYTQERFAKHRGVSRRVIQDIERGVGNPSVDSLNRIAKLWGLQVGLVSVRRKKEVAFRREVDRKRVAAAGFPGFLLRRRLRSPGDS